MNLRFKWMLPVALSGVSVARLLVYTAAKPSKAMNYTTTAQINHSVIKSEVAICDSNYTNVTAIFISRDVLYQNTRTADSGDSTVLGISLRPLACWDCGFEFHRGHGCLSLVNVVICTYSPLRWTDPSSRAVLSSVMYHWVWSGATIKLYTYNEYVDEVWLKKWKENLIVVQMNMKLPTH
jgi:hypothetical protein